MADFAINSLPGLGFLVGAEVTAAGVLSGLPLAGVEVSLLTWGAAWWFKRRFVYLYRARLSAASAVVGDAVRAAAVGTVIG